ncbi:hypothetical protein V1460_02580 [Streptomyces sp. SCSIO 30461]
MSNAGNVGEKMRRAGDSGGTIAALIVISLIAISMALLGLLAIRA